MSGARGFNSFCDDTLYSLAQRLVQKLGATLMAQLRKVLLAIGKVLLAIALGCVALLVVDVTIAFLFGGLQGLFGWPVLTSGMRNLIVLAIFVLGLLIYRQARKASRGKG
jgi:hypothetical protein